jgi:hypothetical protein
MADKNKNDLQKEQTSLNTHRPSASQDWLIKTYQPEGSADVPSEVPELQSGVAPQAIPTGESQTKPSSSSGSEG